VCPQLPNKAELVPVCTSFIPRLSILGWSEACFGIMKPRSSCRRLCARIYYRPKQYTFLESD
jgi:hypothetical protein